MRLWLSLVMGLLLAAPARAGDLVVTATAGGRGVADVVAMAKPQAGIPHGPIRFAWPYRMAQHNLQFDPFVLVAPVGAEVSFPNLDTVRHHVYSFSPAKTFELKLYGRDESRAVRFDKAGVVALGCNIHDAMVAFIRVVDTPFAGKTAASGEVVLRDLPPGSATVTIWHPYLKAPGGEISRTVMIPATGRAQLSIAVDLRRPPMAHGHY